jgi:hypothetical protein
MTITRQALDETIPVKEVQASRLPHRARATRLGAHDARARTRSLTRRTPRAMEGSAAGLCTGPFRIHGARSRSAAVSFR